MGIEEEFSKFTHEVEEKFHDVKEHVILSVERHSFLIAFVLMSVTSAILLIGTIYVWCFHHPRHHREEPSPAEEISAQENKKSNQSEPSEISKENQSPTMVENNKVRKRIPSNSNINNNESPVKSKIPVRMAKVKAT